jgi:hypothetical protein
MQERAGSHFIKGYKKNVSRYRSAGDMMQRTPIKIYSNLLCDPPNSP